MRRNAKSPVANFTVGSACSFMFLSSRLMLAEYALEQYDVEQADAHLDKWAATVAKSRNKKLPEEHQSLSSRLVLLRNMLERT